MAHFEISRRIPFDANMDRETAIQAKPRNKDRNFEHRIAGKKKGKEIRMGIQKEK